MADQKTLAALAANCTSSEGLTVSEEGLCSWPEPLHVESLVGNIVTEGVISTMYIG